MIIDFQQGIITYPSSNNQQVFLAKIGSYVSLQTANGRTDITFAHKTENYLYTESSDVSNAWGPLLPNTNYWLYWDINLLTAVRTFGTTTLAPITSTIEPVAVEGLHWFNPAVQQMYVYQTAGWREVVRVFAARVNNTTFEGMGNNTSLYPFAGTQVGLSISGAVSGRIIVDDTGTPIRRSNGLFFNTENEFFINGSPVNTIRLEANVINGTALENVAKYQVVKFTQFGGVHLAGYDDIQTTVIAMSMEDLIVNQTGTLCVQGVITNPNWNFQTIGAALWVTGAGLLTENDPYVLDPLTHVVSKVPVARVLTRTSVVFDQGLGGKGDKGDSSSTIPVATTTRLGISKLSVSATDPANPIVVETNDPRLVPYTHPATHPATMITTDSYGILSGLSVQTQLHQLSDRNLDSISDVTTPSPSVNDYLKWNGTAWVNAPVIIPPVTATKIDPIVLANLMGDDLIDAPIGTPGIGGHASINGGKNTFAVTDVIWYSWYLPFYPLTIVYLRVTVNGTLYTIEFDLSTLTTYQDVIDRLNVVLAGIAVTTYSYVVLNIWPYNASYITITSIATGVNTSVNIADGLSDGYGGAQYYTGLIESFGTYGNQWDATISPNNVYGTDPLYDTYVDEYYIVGNLPANIPATMPTFIYQFSTPVTASTPVTWDWGAQFGYSIQMGSGSVTGSLVSISNLSNNIGELVTDINNQLSLATCTLDTALNRIVISVVHDSLFQIEDAYKLFVYDVGGSEVWNSLTGILYNTDPGGTTSTLGVLLEGTPTIFQPGVWAKSALSPGDLVCYDQNGRWKSLGQASTLLNGVRVGIAFTPQSDRLASGSFASKDGQVAVYSSGQYTFIPTSDKDEIEVIFNDTLQDDYNNGYTLRNVNSFWNLIGDDQVNAWADRQGPSDILNAVDDTIAPSYTLYHNFLQKYCVIQPRWPTPSISNPTPDNKEIVPLEWLHSRENLTTSSSEVFGLMPTILASMVKSNPGASVIDLNDSRFIPRATTYCSNSTTLTGYVFLGPNNGNLYDLENNLVSTIPYKMDNYAHPLVNGYGNIMSFVMSNSQIEFFAIPGTSYQNNSNMSNIPIPVDSRLICYIPYRGIHPISFFNFSQSNLRFDPNNGVYNPTGLSNDLSYSIQIYDPSFSGESTLLCFSYNTALTKVLVDKGYTTWTGPIGGSYIYAKYYITTTLTMRSQTITEFNVSGPGVFSITCGVSGGTNLDNVYIEVYNATGSTQVFTRAGNLTGTATYAFTLTTNEDRLVRLVTNKISSTGTFVVNWSEIYFSPATQATNVFSNFEISKNNYYPFSTGIYNVTTIRGLIDAMNVIFAGWTDSYGKQLVAGWSFGGRLIISRNDKSSSMDIVSSCSLATALYDSGVLLSSLYTNSINTTTPNLYPRADELYKGFNITIPLVPAP